MVEFILGFFFSAWQAWVEMLRPVPFWDPYGAIFIPLFITTLLVVVLCQKFLEQPSVKST